MTDKKINILLTALELFASEGFNAVPTSKIAKQAGVSEGLIFKHFVSKKGLLDAIVKSAEAKLQVIMAPILEEDSPYKVIERMIDLPFSVPLEEHDFWRLQYKLKWEKEYNKPELIYPVVQKMTAAFEALGVENPEMEAMLLSHTLDAINISILRDGLELQLPILALLKKKYLGGVKE